MPIIPANFPDDSALIPLAKTKRALNKEESKSVLRHIPLLVPADDDKSIRRVVLRLLGRSSEQPNGGADLDVTKNIEALLHSEHFPLPAIVCESAGQAREAIQAILEHRIERGALVLDNHMGDGTGLELFREYGSAMPDGFVKILHTACGPAEMDTITKEGAIDKVCLKPALDLREWVAKLYLQKRFGLASDTK